MHQEHVETTWTEAMTALAVMGILAFLLVQLVRITYPNVRLPGQALQP
jgi:hypothetical protein